MALNITLLVIGMILLVKGADLFVGGSSAIAKACKIPAPIIGLTLVSIGTSAPEASVSINSAINGMNDMSMGNVLGSNIFNTLFILGVSSMIIPLTFGKDIKNYDIPIMVAIYALILVFAFAVTPLTLDRYESVTMLLLFIGYLAFLVLRTLRSHKSTATAPERAAQPVPVEQTSAAQPIAPAPSEIPAKKQKPLWLSIILAAVGLVGVIFGGDMVVDSASDIAIAVGMSEALVGLTIVAVGTSLPELVTSIVAAAKKENGIAVGNVIGSNIFNIIFILGLSSAISPLTFDYEILTDMLVMLGSGIIMLIIALTLKKTTRWSGIVMTLMYVGYLSYIIIRN